MPHPSIENKTAFAAETLHLVDEDFKPLLTVVVKASFDIQPYGVLGLSTEQVPVNLSGEFTHPELENESSYRYEPEVAPFKLATDVVFIAHAHAPRGRTTAVDIGVCVGPLLKSARVFGDRVWFQSVGALKMTPPVQFETMPVTYERAFGGWDMSDPDEGFEAHNPVGRGIHAQSSQPRDGVQAPNIESIDDLIRSAYDRPPPVGFGFVSPNWQPRAALAGTYDEAWQERRAPLLPTDFDRRHFNAASPGLVTSGYLRGNEDIQTVGLSPEGRLDFRLPGVPPPTAVVSLHSLTDHRPRLNLDTVIVDLVERKLFMLWRASLPLPGGPHDLRALELDCPASHMLPRAELITAERPVRAANQIN